MIYLNSDTSSTVTVTLYELCSNIINPYFTWQLIDNDTKQSIVFTADDYSPNAYYYNQFTFSIVSITGSTTPSGSTAGVVYTNSGSFYYKVYEMANQYDLNLDNAIGIVETGILKINGTHSSYQVNTDGDDGVYFVDKSLDF